MPPLACRRQPTRNRGKPGTGAQINDPPSELPFPSAIRSPYRRAGSRHSSRNGQWTTQPALSRARFARPVRMPGAPDRHRIHQQWASLGIGTGEVTLLAVVLISGSSYLSRVRS